MSYNTLAQQADDPEFRDRVDAALQQEARQPSHVDTPESDRVIANTVGVLDQFVWWVADGTEAEYASALAAGNEHPGGDESVIPDQAILSAVQASWDAVLTPATP
jgi:hypothetical protein